MRKISSVWKVFCFQQLSLSYWFDKSFCCNGIEYKNPDKPVVVICIDGCSFDYIESAVYHRMMPNLVKIMNEGFCNRRVKCSLPSFTNVNNMSIVTGTTPKHHGIVGNCYYDKSTNQELMMDSPEYLRCGSILKEAENIGRKVAIISAKDKLRKLLIHGLEESINFSSEKMLDDPRNEEYARLVESVIPESIYSGEASVYVLKAGVALLENNKADFLYLTLSDYIQHMYSPESREAMEFYHELDIEIGKFFKYDALIGITADHAMNSKIDCNTGKPNIVFLEDIVSEILNLDEFRIILPITDPYEIHHSSLGSFAMIYFNDNVNENKILEIRKKLENTEGVDLILDKSEGSEILELPENRIGDMLILSIREFVIGKTSGFHENLKSDAEGKYVLRSHGGRFEQQVPFILSEPLNLEYKERIKNEEIRNFQIFEFLMNGGV